MLANVNRDAKRHPDPYMATDFIYWHESHRDAAGQEGVLLPDLEAQSRLIKRSIFKSA